MRASLRSVLAIPERLSAQPKAPKRDADVLEDAEGCCANSRVAAAAFGRLRKIAERLEVEELSQLQLDSGLLAQFQNN